MTNLDKALLEFGLQVDRDLEDFAAWSRAPVKDPEETVHWAFALTGLAVSIAGIIAIIVALVRS